MRKNQTFRSVDLESQLQTCCRQTPIAVFNWFRFVVWFRIKNKIESKRKGREGLGKMMTLQRMIWTRHCAHLQRHCKRVINAMQKRHKQLFFANYLNYFQMCTRRSDQNSQEICQGRGIFCWRPKSSSVQRTATACSSARKLRQHCCNTSSEGSRPLGP